MSKATEDTTTGPERAPGPQDPQSPPEAGETPPGAPETHRTVPAAAYDLMMHAQRHGWHHRLGWMERNGGWTMKLEIGRKIAPGEVVADRVPGGRDRWLYQLVWSVDRPQPGGGNRTRPFLISPQCRYWGPEGRRPKAAPSLARIVVHISSLPAPSHRKNNGRGQR